MVKAKYLLINYIKKGKISTNDQCEDVQPSAATPFALTKLE